MIKEKIKKIFDETKDKKKVDNLIAILIVLIIAVIAINTLFSDTEKDKSKTANNTTGKELAKSISNETHTDNIEEKLKNILSQIKDVGNVEVLITYSESSSVVPIYNEKNSKSTTEEVDTTGGTRTIESYNTDKEVVNGSNSEPVTEKVIVPKIEGAIITAEGASNTQVKSNIIAAVEAVTGIATHKIQVFEMKNN